jgi:WD40 repeat protein
VSDVVLYTLEAHTGLVFSVGLSSDSLRMESGSSDCTVRICNCVSGVALHTLKGYSEEVQSSARLLLRWLAHCLSPF